MIVYVETNFMLELAYLQEGCDSCHEILRLAEQDKLSLVLPGYCAIEARARWRQQAGRRAEMHSELQREIAQLSRSRDLKDLRTQSGALTAALVDNVQQDRTRLEAALEKIVRFGTIHPLTPSITTTALHLEQDCSLSPQDGVVLASVI